MGWVAGGNVRICAFEALLKQEREEIKYKLFICINLRASTQKKPNSLSPSYQCFLTKYFFKGKERQPRGIILKQKFWILFSPHFLSPPRPSFCCFLQAHMSNFTLHFTNVLFERLKVQSGANFRFMDFNNSAPHHHLLGRSPAQVPWKLIRLQLLPVQNSNSFQWS